MSADLLVGPHASQYITVCMDIPCNVCYITLSGLFNWLGFRYLFLRGRFAVLWTWFFSQDSSTRQRQNIFTFYKIVGIRDKKNACKIVVAKPNGKWPLGRPSFEGMILKDVRGKVYWKHVTGGCRLISSSLGLGLVEGICQDDEDLLNCTQFGQCLVRWNC